MRAVQPDQAGNGQARQAGRVQAATIERLERSMGSLGTAAMAAMDKRLAWFRAMSA
ncbi:MAG TPA: PucR family transcriptional regulator, partial [Streptosporangiaceae bacterium]|nr:PucR family transcriptional regulator [Streptosporangiaceae bacterium]